MNPSIHPNHCLACARGNAETIPPLVTLTQQCNASDIRAWNSGWSSDIYLQHDFRSTA